MIMPALPLDGEAGNPLERLLAIAVGVAAVTAEMNEMDFEPGTVMWRDQGEVAQWACDADGAFLYDSRELAGVAGLFDQLRRHPHLQPVYVNDFAWDHHGFDAVYWDRRDNTFLLCEAKGSGASAVSVPSLLRQTKSKGRQLSWCWCWRSLVEVAELGTASPLFVLMFQAFLDGRVRRLLSLSHLEKRSGGWRIMDSRLWGEDDLVKAVPALAEPHDLTRQRAWLTELRANGCLRALDQWIEIRLGG